MGAGKKKHRVRPRRRRPAARPGTPPGTIVTGPATGEVPIQVMAYGAQGLVERTALDLQELSRLRAQWPTVWINVDGVDDSDSLRKLQEHFGLHPLALEDVVNLGQRPKIEPYDEHLFLVVSMPPRDANPFHEQVSMFIDEGLVLTFQESPGDCFEPVRERLRAGKGRIRRAGPDYLAYALIDSVVDSYFPSLERIGERLEQLEDRILSSTGEHVPETLQSIRSELREMRRSNLPHRDLVAGLALPGTPFVSEETRLYLRDCLDHVVRVSDLVDSFREESSDLMHLHLAGISNRMNEVMKVLTIMAAIFIPLGFIAGVYGMNFSADSPWNMPELRWRWGYPAVLTLMGAVAAGLLIFFKRRRWF